jgi:RES domain-containing protein
MEHGSKAAAGTSNHSTSFMPAWTRRPRSSKKLCIPHIVTKFLIEDFTMIEIVEPSQISNPNWLRPGTPNSAQQAFLAARLTSLAKPFVLVPSVISPESWNVLFDPSVAKGKYRVMDQTRFALDQRLSP